MSVLGSSPTTGTKAKPLDIQGVFNFSFACQVFFALWFSYFVCLRILLYVLLYTVSCTKPCTGLYEIPRPLLRTGAFSHTTQ